MPIDDLAAAGDEVVHARDDLVALREARERPHRDAFGARVAEHDLRREARRAPRRSTASTDAVGTMIRRIAVHFCPAFAVISVTTDATNASNSAVPGDGVGTEDRGVDRVGLGRSETPRTTTASSRRSIRPVDASR